MNHYAVQCHSSSTPVHAARTSANQEHKDCVSRGYSASLCSTQESQSSSTPVHSVCTFPKPGHKHCASRDRSASPHGTPVLHSSSTPIHTLRAALSATNTVTTDFQVCSCMYAAGNNQPPPAFTIPKPLPSLHTQWQHLAMPSHNNASPAEAWLVQHTTCPCRTCASEHA
jgi:hypothetical protein